MGWEVVLGLGEWVTWVGLCAVGLHWYNRLLLWLWYLTAQMQAKIDERNDLQNMQDGGDDSERPSGR